LASGFVQVEGGRLYYEAAGDGPPLVLIHAGFLDSRMWDSQFQVFAKTHRVIRYDVRGFGKSDRPTEKFSDAADLLALVQHLNLAKVILVGVSNGGRIALDFTVQHPERVERLVLVATGVHGYESGPEEDKVWEEFEKKMKPQKDLAREGRIREAVEMDVNAWAPAQSPGSREHILSIALDNSHILSSHPGKLQVSPDPPAFKRLSEIRVPTLLMIGDRDVEGMRMIMERLHGMITGSKKVLIRGADHIVNASRPEEFNQAVLDFLA